MNENPSSAYRTVDALTSDPIVLTTMLFEGAVKSMRKARLRHEEQNRRGYLDEIARAQMIVGELWSTLDLDQGELPRTLSASTATVFTRSPMPRSATSQGSMKPSA